MPADPMSTHVAKTLAHDSPLMSCRFDPTGQFVFAGDQNGKIVRWELSKGTKTELVGANNWVRSLAFSANGETLVTGGYDGRLIWWPAMVDDPVPDRAIQAHEGWIRAIAVSPDRKSLATCGNDLKVKLWSFEDGTLLKELTGHERHVYHVCFHPDGKQLLSGDLTAKFRHWDIESGKLVRDFAVGCLSIYDKGFQADYGGPVCLKFAADGKHFFAGGIANVTNAFAGVGNPVIAQIDWETGKEAVIHQPKVTIRGTAWGIDLHPEGFLIAATGGGDGGHLFFFRLDQKEEFHSLKIANAALDMDRHPDGIQIATVHFDKNLRISPMSPKAAG